MVEMTVVLAIIAVITSITISSQTGFNKTIVLANTAYDIALTMRNAQTYGIGSKNVTTNFVTGFGLSFANPATPLTSFTLFADIYPDTLSGGPFCHPQPVGSPANAPDAHPGDCVYESGQNERQQTYTLGNNMKINKYCVKQAGVWACSPSITQLDIVFTRPNTSAVITTIPSSGPLFSITDACVQVYSPQATARSVRVTDIGQITTSTTTCP